MSERDEIAYNQTSGGLPRLEEDSTYIAADVCFLHHSAPADAL